MSMLNFSLTNFLSFLVVLDVNLGFLLHLLAGVKFIKCFYSSSLGSKTCQEVQFCVLTFTFQKQSALQ